MKCPYCNHQKDKVIDSREINNRIAVRRRRECLTCGKRFTTYEHTEGRPLALIKKDGRRESFDR
ncbi:transcriptional regulator NrdR, partial [bacterium]|nr:transcriptional regulator NrdR [bacterium]